MTLEECCGDIAGDIQSQDDLALIDPALIMVIGQIIMTLFENCQDEAKAAEQIRRPLFLNRVRMRRLVADELRKDGHHRWSKLPSKVAQSMIDRGATLNEEQSLEVIKDAQSNWLT